MSRADALSSVISKISGVQAARVVEDGDRVSEVHVVAVPGRAPKQLVRDVQSAAKATFDIDVDYRTVSVVQIDPDTDAAPSAPKSFAQVEPRLPLVKVADYATGELATVAVILSDGGSELEGVARGSTASLAVLTARATLAAFAPRLGGVAAEVTAVESIKVGGDLVAIVVVELVSAEGALRVSGAAIDSSGTNDAFARATLDAVNRFRPR